MVLSCASFEFLYHHLAFPPKLPQEQEQDENDYEAALIALVLRACDETSTASQTSSAWLGLCKAFRRLQTCRSIGHAGSLSERGLKKVLVEMVDEDVFILPIRCQNCALLFTRKQDDVIVECFEVSARNKDVMTSTRLAATFPTHAVLFPANVFSNEIFQERLCAFLVTVDRNTFPQFQRHSTKAGISVAEVRDTTDPAIVSELLFTILGSFGSRHASTTITKYVLDEVCWNDCLLPWRRSPLWLTVRVAVKLILSRAEGPADGENHYKNFICRIISLLLIDALDRDASTEQLHVINSKISQKAGKLGDRLYPEVAVIIKANLDKSRQKMQQRFATTQASLTCRIERVPHSSVLDTSIHLSGSRNRICRAFSRPSGDESDIKFPTLPRIKIQALSAHELPGPSIFTCDSADEIQTLFCFESWVQDHLSSWIAQTCRKEKDCVLLGDLILSYRQCAQRCYKSSPKHMSLMYLTTFKLWCGLDEIAARLYPLLKQYNPEIPVALLEPLLLTRKDEFLGLLFVEEYLQKRHTSANRLLPSMFGEMHSESFAVRYFDSSNVLQSLKRRIDDDTNAHLAKLRAEWRSKNEQFNQLMAKSEPLNCEEELDEDDNLIHKSTCRRCALKAQAQAIVMPIYELPLPRDINIAKAVVFELACPEVLRVWRDITWALLFTLTSSSRMAAESPSMAVTLWDYDLLQRYRSTSVEARVTLASRTKSFLRSHYGSQGARFPCDFDRDICVPNALHYSLFDTEYSGRVWTTSATLEPSIKDSCTLHGFDVSYSVLRWALRSSNHTENDVIADQGSCPKGIAIPEFKAFGSLRGGQRVQWLDIYRELYSSDLQWNSTATKALMKQTIWEAGKRIAMAEARDHNEYAWIRRPHVDLSNRAIAMAILEAIRIKHDSIKANWKEIHSMDTLISLTSSIALLSRSYDTARQAREIIKLMRQTLTSWIKDLHHHVRGLEDSTEIKESQRRLVQACLSGRATFEAFKDLPCQEVFPSAESVALFVQCAIIIKDNLADERTSEIEEQYIGDRRLAVTMIPLLQDFSPTAEIGNGIIAGFRSIWNESGTYSPLSFANSDRLWITAMFTGCSNRKTMTVHFNILSGILLIAGERIGRLPQDITSNAMYKDILGPQVLDVVPSDMTDMTYKVAHEICGYIVHFGFVGKDLIIRTTRGNEVLELIERKLFAPDLPESFHEDHVHWLNLCSREIELRLRSNPWESEEANWRITFSSQMNDAFCHSNGRYLIDKRRPLSRIIHDIFKHFEQEQHIHIIRSKDKPLEIELPRFRLRFVVREDGQLHCRELNAIVNINQKFATFIGLQSKLVLQEADCSIETGRSFVIVPRGSLRCNKFADHVKIHVDLPSGKRLRYVTFEVDPVLHRLRRPADIESRLFQVLLHALSSHFLPDPFTARTGTEVALDCLRDAALFSSSPLTSQAQHLLGEIAQLTPGRDYYPSHLTEMQRTYWRDDISFVLQHPGFLLEAQGILEYNNQFHIFHRRASVPLSHRSNLDLVSRSVSRTRFMYAWRSEDMVADLRTNNFAPNASSTKADARQQGVSEVASLLKNWGAVNKVTENIYTRFCTWGRVSGFGTSFQTPSLDKLLRLDFSQSFGSIYHLCRKSQQDVDMWKLMFLLCPVAFGQHTVISDIRTVLEFAFRQDCPGFDDLPSGTYDVSLGHEPSHASLHNMLNDKTTPFRPKARRESRWSYDAEKQAHDFQAARHISKVEALVLRSWPCEKPPLPEDIDSRYVSRYSISHVLGQRFETWQRNSKLYEACKKVEKFSVARNLNLYSAPTRPSLIVASNSMEPRDPCWMAPTLAAKTTVPCHISAAGTQPSVISDLARVPYKVECSKLLQVVQFTRRHEEGTRNSYASDLEASISALKSSAHENSSAEIAPHNKLRLRQHLHEHQRYIKYLLSLFVDFTGATSDAEQILDLAGKWPQVDEVALLSILSSEPKAHSTWKEQIVLFGCAITMSQRASRLLRFAELDMKVIYQKELANPGYEGWDPMNYPVWLLMQIEHNFMIRKTQADVAKRMMSPPEDQNAVMQLNMGEGKSSVIIPMVAAALANGKQLVRTVVLKPLLPQMERVLTQRLGGFVRRKIVSVPCSRQTGLKAPEIRRFLSMCKSWMQNNSVMLAQPEHILSLKLMALDRIYGGDLEVAYPLSEVHFWLRRNCRDLLDESDELLSPSYELVYTIGSQKLVHGQPNRWLLTQSVSTLIEKHAYKLKNSEPQAIEVGPARPGAFRHLQIHDINIMKTLVAAVVRDIGRGKLDGVSFDHYPPETRDAALCFIKHRQIPANVKKIIDQDIQNSTMFYSLLILRGLFAYDIFAFALQQKRWLVNYGLDLTRCLSAVPYRAKGVPSATAEFGHPDCSIVLTSLSFYYTGLTGGQLRQSFRLLYEMADPSVEFHVWQARSTLSSGLRTLSGINLDDSRQWSREVFPNFRFNKATIDFFLAKVAFPREAKEFEFKLSTSAWDLASECTQHFVTGFSGTNDLRLLNPLSITVCDLPELVKTSALVLNNLLRFENQETRVAIDAQNRKLDTAGLIKLIEDEDTRVQIIIDVGAQVLEFTNREVIAYWLSLNSSLKGGVFFNEKDTPMFMDAAGIVEPLFLSSFCGRLDDCVVFLDEAHTRGIDLDLPTNFRAAVTIGPGLTKDRFVQACMRLRKLAHGQSLLSILPPAVCRSVRDLRGKSDASTIDISDIIAWTFEQTCQQLDRFRPMWLSKGLSHTRRRLALDIAVSDHKQKPEMFVHDINTTARLLEATKEREARTLDELYFEDTVKMEVDELVAGSQDPIAQRLTYQVRNLENVNIVKDAAIHEEQEREVEFEVEVEREVQRPGKVVPSQPSLHPSVINLVSTGLPLNHARDGAFNEAFASLAFTSAEPYLPYDSIKPSLLVTQDFCRTIRRGAREKRDEFLRSVRWLLSSTETNTLFIISQYETNELLPRIRRSNKVTLHIYAPRVAKMMKSFYEADNLTISGAKTPRPKITQENLVKLNLFAGALYLDNYDQYKSLCNFLGIVGGGRILKRGAKPQEDGFVEKKDREAVGWTESEFVKSPIPLVREILALRRSGENFNATHMGKIVSGRVLREEDFE